MNPTEQPHVPDYVKNPKLLNAKVFIGLPTYDGRVHQSTVNLKRTCSQVVGRVPTLAISATSALCRNFNNLWCAALNMRSQGYTHFVLIHEDVHPQEVGWLDKMLAILDHTGDHVLSAVSPMKEGSGLTSTALDRGPGATPQRLTMREIMEQPETFTDDRLLINTGLLMIDMRAPWVEEVWFEMIDRIVKRGDGLMQAVGDPEDWNFSRMVRAKGGRVWATRAIPLIHRGGGEFRNNHAWGTKTKDE